MKSFVDDKVKKSAAQMSHRGKLEELDEVILEESAHLMASQLTDEDVELIDKVT